MNTVFVCSQLRGNLRFNIERAYDYCRYVMAQGHAAFAPHGFYTAFLDDLDEAQRHQGMEAGKAWLRVAKEVWVFVREGLVSDGMTKEVLEAIQLGIPLRWFAVVDLNTVVPLPHCPPDAVPQPALLLPPQQFAAQAASRFAAMEARLRNGEFYEDVSEGLDELLGTVETERDREAEALWAEAATVLR